MILPRLYPILDTHSLAARQCPLQIAAEAMLDGGARILQIRHKGHWPRERFAEAERIRALCDARGVPLVVNDRADIAVLLDADLHVGQDDLAPPDARRVIGDRRALGFSTHNAKQLADAASQPVDYVALGPIFATGSKEEPDPVVGLEQLRQWRPLTAKPLVAIGGITRANATAVLDAGAGSLAVIGDLLPDPCTPAALRQRMEQWQRLVTQ